MATYYVRPDGSNTNTGTGPGVGSAWQTIGKALASGSPVVGGDTVYISPGTYREGVTVGIAPSSNVNITADPKALQFPGMTPDLVRWSAYTAGDNADPTVTPCNLGSASNLTFTDFVVDGHVASANGNCFHVSGPAQNITWRRCVMTARTSSCIRCASSSVVTFNWTIDSCYFQTNGTAVAIIPTDSVGSLGAINLNIVVTNCVFDSNLSNSQLALQPTLAAGTFVGGMTVYNCIFHRNSYGIYCNPINAFTTLYQVVVRNCIFIRSNTASMNESLGGFINENYNRCIAASRNVTNLGANTIASGIAGLDYSHGWIHGLTRYAHYAGIQTGVVDGSGTATGAPATDMFGNTRPSPLSQGPFERIAITASGVAGLLAHPGNTGGMRG